MPRFKHRLLCIVTALLLAGCYSMQPLDTLRKTELKGTNFQVKLARLYRDFAEQESANNHWKSAQRFANKGLAVAHGSEVMPEDPTAWMIPMKKRAALVAAREELLDELKEPATTKNPEASAGVMFYYDCWVAQEEDHQSNDVITVCKQEFDDAIISLNKLKTGEKAEDGEADDATDAPGITPAFTAPAVAPAPAAAAKPAEAPKAALTLSTSYLVFFEWARSDLTHDGKQVVADVINDLKSHTDYQIVLNGHTDTSGPDDYNLELSQKRAEVVQAALIAGGIPKNRMTLYAFGESDPRVPTGDGVREPMNRRVEIFINP